MDASTRTECAAEYQHALVEQAVEDSITDLCDILRCITSYLDEYRTKLDPAESAPSPADQFVAANEASDVRDTLVRWVADAIPARLKTLDLDDRVLDHEQMIEQARAAFLSSTDINLG